MSKSGEEHNINLIPTEQFEFFLSCWQKIGKLVHCFIIYVEYTKIKYIFHNHEI